MKKLKQITTILILLTSTVGFSQITPYGNKIRGNAYIVVGSDTLWLQPTPIYTNFYATSPFYFRDSSNVNYLTIHNNMSVLGTSAFTGVATGLTASAGDNSTKFATTAFVNTAIGSYFDTTNIAYTNIPNTFAATQSITGNLILTEALNRSIYLDKPTFGNGGTLKIYSGGSNDGDAGDMYIYGSDGVTKGGNLYLHAGQGFPQPGIVYLGNNGSGYVSDVYTKTQSSKDSSANLANTLYVDRAVAAAGGGGSTTFLGLTDVPSSYSGSGEYALFVNSTPDAVEFRNINATGNLSNIAYKGQDNLFTTSQTITGNLNFGSGGVRSIQIATPTTGDGDNLFIKGSGTNDGAGGSLFLSTENGITNGGNQYYYCGTGGVANGAIYLGNNSASYVTDVFTKTQSAKDSSNRVASTEYVDKAVALGGGGGTVPSGTNGQFLGYVGTTPTATDNFITDKNVADNTKFNFGASNDFYVSHETAFGLNMFNATSSSFKFEVDNAYKFFVDVDLVGTVATFGADGLLLSEDLTMDAGEDIYFDDNTGGTVTANTPTSGDGADVKIAGGGTNDGASGDIEVYTRNGITTGGNIYLHCGTGGVTNGAVYLGNYISGYNTDVFAKTQSASDNSNKLATTAYVDNAVSGGGSLPSQTGFDGSFLTTNGTSASWSYVVDTNWRFDSDRELWFGSALNPSKIYSSSNNLYFEVEDMLIGDGTSTGEFARFYDNSGAGYVGLRYNSDEKFKTTFTGITVTGDCNTSDNFRVADTYNGISGGTETTYNFNDGSVTGNVSSITVAGGIITGITTYTAPVPPPLPKPAPSPTGTGTYYDNYRDQEEADIYETEKVDRVLSTTVKHTEFKDDLSEFRQITQTFYKGKLINIKRGPWKKSNFTKTE